MFNCARVSYLDPSKSDHVPLLIELERIPNQGRRRPRLFRFENFWAEHEECESIIRDTWNQPITRVPMYRVVSKIRATRLALIKWNQAVFKH
ncbi:hypothetical protein EV2_033289 [Malus domestica]